MSNETIAFLGATGGCTLAALVRTLNAGIDARALVRTPSKLVDLLRKRGVSQAIIDAHLTVLEGNAKDVEAVKQLFAGPQVSLVVFGVGGAPKFNPSITSPFTLDDPAVCADSTRALLAALASPPKPLSRQPDLAFISTTGLNSAVRDVPWGFQTFYRYTLHIPHVDKKEMERLVEDSGRQNYVLLHPSLLMDSPTKGKKTRVGWEGEGGKLEVGYTIGRDAVGEWIFQALIEGSEEARKEWFGRKVTLTW
ncbi:hypothetical protein JCM8097_004827 [Rhodosporidiobolus ruineniae]